MGETGRGPKLRLDTVTSPGRSVVIVRGDIDADSVEELRATVRALGDHADVVEFDLTELGFLDSTGLGVLAALIRQLEPTGGRVELRAVPARVERLLEITDLRRFVTVLSTRP